MQAIFVNKSKLIVNDQEILLKGVSLPDPYWLRDKEKQEIKETISLIKDLGFNTVRIPILPGHFVYHKGFIDKTIKKIADTCLERGLYCILDWHAIGNPLHNETRLKEYFHVHNHKKIFWYLADKKIAIQGIKQLSESFGEMPNVIFEIYNEPCPAEKNVSRLNLSALPFEKWKKIAVELIKIIRENSNNLIIVSSNYWSFNLKDTAKKPYDKFANIAYSFHCYPLKNNKNWKEMLESLKKFPIVVTEFGYDTDEKSQYKSSYKNYLKPFIEYLTQKQISWIGWCFSASWRPRIVSKWEPFKLSEFGKHLLEYLDQ
ncbi:MAG: glycoside hydrolase family 5 protein [Nanoarchaeota archaeon]